jgi:murein DD-endopeptidase MepM/ murein hydrolase activator NlpD
VNKKRAYAGLAGAVLSAAMISVAIPTTSATAAQAGTTSAAAMEDMSWSLYNLDGGRITAGFDGYSNTPGRHEGIDIARASGSPVRALIGGTVTNVVEFDAYGMSTIAIYNATFDKTIVYLHSNPLDTLYVGQAISRDERIGTEASRGAGGVHTHVEMRLGRKTLAARSSDSTLDNPNPNDFWRARGYYIR